MPQSVGELEYEQQPRNQERVHKKKERKWTLGNLFRRKKVKDSDTDSSDSDATEDGKKVGFLARRRHRRANRGSKDVSQSFEHVILRPSAEGNAGPTDGKKSLKARVEASRDSLLKESSSEEECSHTKPRASRSKHSSRDMSDSNMKLMELDSSPRSPRWTAKVVYCESSDYDARYTAHTRSATPSPAQSPIAKIKHLKRPPIPQSNAPRPLHCQKSASFDILPRQTQNYYHTSPNHNHQYHQRPSEPQSRIPPPPPPRDPQRKIIPPQGYQPDRPLSYAFESNQPLPKVLTDHNSNITAYKVNSSSSLDHQPVYKINSSSSLDHKRTYQYYTDQQPRSRRPIHIARVDQPYLSDSQISQIRSSDWRIPRDSNSSLYDSSDSREGGTDARPLSMVVETTEHLSQQQELPEKKELKRKSSNLEDALNELEAIYKSLQMRDEDPPSRGFESDSGYYRVVDDMAYRRLNRRESAGSPDCRRVMSQAGSYLLVSPTLSPPPFANAPVVPTPQNEPDVTLDDVVYRNIRHVNNTLKVADPQPPFGIPLGPVAPAPSSDYLHATPKQLYRPTFKPRKTPDIVKDDLAYRNLRKDGQNDSLLSNEDSLLNENPSNLKKKRAVRSLSANLLSIIQKEQLHIENQNNKNYDLDNFEKSQSYSDLPDVIDTRYRRSYSTEDADVTPRVSRLYADLPISTTSTETLTDSRTNITNTQESCSSKIQYLPLASKQLPKTDFAKLRLPSPSSQQISLPKKLFQNLDNSAASQCNTEKVKLRKLNENHTNKSPNSSLKVRMPLNSLERNNSKSPSPYYSANEAPVITNSNTFVSDNYTSSCPGNLQNNMVCSSRGDSSDNEHVSQYGDYYNDECGKLDTENIESRKCMSQSSIHDQRLKMKNNEQIMKASSFISHINSNSADKEGKSNSEKKIQNQLSNISQSYGNFSRTNNHINTDMEFMEQDYVTDLSPVSLNPPKISIRGRVQEENVKTSSVFAPSSALSNVNSRSSFNPSNQITPKVSENKISIEGIKLVIPSEIKVTVGHQKSSNLLQPTENFKENLVLSSTLTSRSTTDCTNNVRVPSPRSNASLEKSRQKMDTETSHTQHLLASNERGNNGNRNNKAGVPRPRSSINIKNSSENNKNTTPRPKSSVTQEINGARSRLPSPCLYLNTEKHNSDDRVKSKSSSPCLPDDSSEIRIPSPCLSIAPEKSPVSKRSSDSSPKRKRYLTNSSENISSGMRTSNTSPNYNKMQSCQQALHPSKNLDTKNIIMFSSQPKKLVNSCTDELQNRILNEPVDIENSSNFIFQNKKVNENISSDSGATCSTNEIDANSSPYLNSSCKKKSLSINNLSHEIIKGDSKLKPNRSELKSEKDLNQLLVEINDKQGEILSGKPKSVSTSDISLVVDKKDCLALGKITPHKPVKLTTFSINDNNTIENNETIILPDRKNEIIGTSESMTDLLRELTRSLDQDFGCLTTKDNEYQVCEADTTNVIERTIHKSLEEEQERLLDNSKSSDSQELNNTDEADNEVMEINRVVLEQKECKSDVKNINNENLTGFVAVKGKHNQTISIMDGRVGGKCEIQTLDKTVVINEAECSSVHDKRGYCSDDSNAEFVEAICKTASELSALSTSSNTTGLVVSSQQKSFDSTPNSSMMTDGKRWSRPPQSRASDLDQNEGTCNNKMDCSPVLHPSGLIMFCTFCIAQLQQLIDLDFLTILGLLIAIVSLILLLVL